jgi:hypothetical protein
MAAEYTTPSKLKKDVKKIVISKSKGVRGQDLGGISG